jgi:hypothetical protein
MKIMRLYSYAVLLFMLIPVHAMAQVYEEDFVQGESYETGTPEGDRWNAFTAEIGVSAAGNALTNVRLSGSNDPTGMSCTDPSVVNQLGAALSDHPNGAAVVDCDGNTWRVGVCGAGQEISVNTTGICGCPLVGYTLRPTLQTNNPNWGGINTATCNGPTQTIKLEFNGGAPPSTYSVGGTVTGLTGTGLELQNNGVDTLAITANDVFAFVTELQLGFSYVVTVSTQPTGQTCTVSNGSGTISDADVTDVAVTCADNPTDYTINGTVSGLGPNSVTLQNNGADDRDVDANGVFVFDTALPDGSSYDVTVLTQPTGQTCDVTNGVGTINGSDVLGVDVDCLDDVVAPPTPMAPIPTLSEWALILLTMFIGLMVFANRRRLF